MKKYNKQTKTFEAWADPQEALQPLINKLNTQAVPYHIINGEIIIEDKDESSALTALQ